MYYVQNRMHYVDLDDVAQPCFLHKWIIFLNISHQAESLLFPHASLSALHTGEAFCWLQISLSCLEMNTLKCWILESSCKPSSGFFPSLYMHRVISCSSDAEQYQVRNFGWRALSLSRQNSISAEYSDQLITIPRTEIMEMLNCKDAIGLIELPASKAIIQFVIAHKGQLFR